MTGRFMFALAISAALASPVDAFSIWTGNGANNNWSTAGNWSGGIPVSGQNTDVEFSSGGSWTSANQNLGNPFTLNTLTVDFGSTVTTLTGNGIQFMKDSSGMFLPQLTQDGVTTINNPLTLNDNLKLDYFGLTLNGGISGAGGLLDQSTALGATLTLAATNTYTGSTTFTGTVIVPAGGSINNTSALTVGGALSINGGAVTSVGDVSVFGPVTITAGSLSGVNVAVSGSVSLTAGSISASSLLLDGGGTFALGGTGQLSATSTSVGITGHGAFIQSGGTHTINFLALGGNTGSSGDYTLSSGTLNTQGSNVNLGGVFTQTGGSHTITGNLQVTNGNGSGYTLSGGTLSASVITHVGFGGTGTFTQSGGTHTTGTLSLGRFLGNSGTYLLYGGALATTVTQLGLGGAGTFIQTGGTHTVSNTVYLGKGATAFGDYTLAGGLLVTPVVALGAGTGAFHFDGGTLRAAADTAGLITGLASADVRSHGAVIDTNGHTVTVGVPLVHDANSLGIAPDGGLTKIGAGSLTLTGANTYTGGTFINGGTLTVADDTFLGNSSGTITLQGSGQLVFTAPSVTTARTFNLNFSSQTAAAGQLLTYNGAAVYGGFLHGPGTFVIVGGASLAGVTTSPNAVISQNAAGSFVNFTNGGSLTVAAGAVTPASFSTFTNQGSGSITIAGNSQVNAAEFQTYGTVTLAPGSMAKPTQMTNTGASPLFFNGGSRTFVSIPANAGQFDAGIDLAGQNAVVAGGLFVNNGYVVDSVGAGNKTIVADFGALVKGAGFYQNSVQTINGGKFQSGNSPGKSSFGNFTFGPGGVTDYVFAIDDATGMAGPRPDANGQVSGWGLVSAVRRSVGSITTPGDFAWTADPAHKVTIALDTLLNPTRVGMDVAGPMDNFDRSRPYEWPAVQWIGAYTGPTAARELNAATTFDLNAFANPIGGDFGWSLDPAGHTLSLMYTPTSVPEPGTLALLGIAAIGFGLRRGRRLSLLVIVGCGLASPNPAAAQTWIGNFSGNWGGPNNWSPNVVPASSANTQLTFGATANASMSNGITDPNPFILNRLTFNAGSPTYSLSTDPLDFRLKGFASFPAIVMNSNNGFTIDGGLILTDNFSVFGAGTGTVTLNQAINGNGSLTYSGAGTLTLSAVESYLGGTFVTSGTLNMSAFSALPYGQSVTVGNGAGPAVFNFQSIGNSSAGTAIGTLTLNGGSFRVPSGSGHFYLNLLNMTGGSVDFTGTSNFWLHFVNGSSGITTSASSSTATWIGAGTSRIQNDTASPLTITVNAGSVPGGLDLDAGIILSGAGSNPNFVKAGAGVMRLTNTGNTANFTVNAGTLRVDDVTSGPSGFGALGSGSLTVNGGTLQYGGGSITTTKNITLGSTSGAFSTIQLLTPGANVLYEGTITEAASGNNLTLSGPGSGQGPSTLTMVGNQNYSGITSVGGNGVLATPNINDSGQASPIGTWLAVNIGNANGRGTLLLTGTGSSYSTNRVAYVAGVYSSGAGGAIGVQNAATNLTWTEQINDLGTPGSFIKTGAGTLTLTNSTNSYTGGTYVESGALIVGAPGAVIPANTDVTVSAGATLALGFNGDNSAAPVRTLTLSGGTFGVVVGAHVDYYLTQLVTGAAGGTVDFTAGGNLHMSGSPRVTINGNTSWIGNSALFENASSNEMDVIIAPGATLTNALPFSGPTDGPFHISGGGTLYMATPQSPLVAYYVVSQGRLRVDDLTVNSTKSVLGRTTIPGFLALDGGILQYSGSTGAGMIPISLTSSGGTLEVSNPATTLTYSGAVSGFGPFIKGGPGVLILNNLANSYAGGLVVNGGRIDVSDDAQLGAASPTVNPAGTLRYTTSLATSRTFNLNGGTLEAAISATLTLNGAAVNGGFLRGTFAVTGGTVLSGVTAGNSATVAVSGPASFVNVTNGGSLTVAAGLAAPTTISQLTNQGSGTIAIGAGSAVSAADFQTYGVLSLNPGSSAVPTQLTCTGGSNLYFNGGSRTFISIPSHASQIDAGIDLNGHNAIVAGGLLVNNGYVIDSAAAGKAAIVADFGSLVKGAGFYQNPVQTVNGGKFQSGNSPGRASFGSFTFGPGGVSNYVFAIDDATGTAGPSPDANGRVSGWGLVQAIQQPIASSQTPGDFAWTATPAQMLTVHLDTLLNPTTVGTDVSGPMADFDSSKPYSWLAASWAGTYTGPTDPSRLTAATAFDGSAFLNPVAGRFGWNVDLADRTLSLTYTPSAVPELGTLAQTLAVAVWVTAGRRRPKLPCLKRAGRPRAP
jgi:autotransporter-associated beta strand protein